MYDIAGLSAIDTALDSRSISFENPTGARGTGGQAHGGRKGSPWRVIDPGERVTLADIEGPGIVRHIWMTFPPAPPEAMRAVTIEGFYDGTDRPSISAPCVDFFGVPHGRPVPFASAATSIQEGRGFNSYLPMPFRQNLRLELVNAGERPILLFYQVDYTLQPVSQAGGYLHVTFRRENPTVMRRDFVIFEGLRGPGRFAGCNVGVRVLDEGPWYGEGEVKMYRDGDRDFPTICGTGLEDYVGSAWGMGPHVAPYAGVPLSVAPPDREHQPAFVGFYRWHLPDPVVFLDELRVTIQQIGYAIFRDGEEEAFERYAEAHPVAGRGWERHPRPGIIAQGIVERVDDYCATAYVYCREPQPVPRLEVAAATKDIGPLDYERIPQAAL